MARVTVEKCLEKFDNRFDLVLTASKRARQILEGGVPLVDRENDKQTVIALREIEADFISQSILDEEDLSGRQKDMLAEFSASNLKREEVPASPWNKPIIDAEEDEEGAKAKSSTADSGEAPSDSAAGDAAPAKDATDNAASAKDATDNAASAKDATDNAASAEDATDNAASAEATADDAESSAQQQKKED